MNAPVAAVSRDAASDSPPAAVARARHVRAVILERQDQQDRRRIATRYEKLAIQYLAMLSVSLIEKYLATLFANTA